MKRLHFFPFLFLLSHRRVVGQRHSLFFLQLRKMDLFSSYRHIDVAHIVRSNIRRDSVGVSLRLINRHDSIVLSLQVHEDLRKLIDGLNPLMLLTRNPMRPGAKLAWAIIDRIERLVRRWFFFVPAVGDFPLFRRVSWIF